MFKLECLTTQLEGKKYIDDCAAEMLVSCSVGVSMKSSKKKTSSDTKMNHIMKP